MKKKRVLKENLSIKDKMYQLKTKVIVLEELKGEKEDINEKLNVQYL